MLASRRKETGAFGGERGGAGREGGRDGEMRSRRRKKQEEEEEEEEEDLFVSNDTIEGPRAPAVRSRSRSRSRRQRKGRRSG